MPVSSRFLLGYGSHKRPFHKALLSVCCVGGYAMKNRRQYIHFGLIGT